MTVQGWVFVIYPNIKETWCSITIIVGQYKGSLCSYNCLISAMQMQEAFLEILANTQDRLNRESFNFISIICILYCKSLYIYGVTEIPLTILPHVTLSLSFNFQYSRWNSWSDKKDIPAIMDMKDCVCCM